MLDLDREELLTVLRLVEWRISEHKQTMRDIAPEGYIEHGTAEDYENAKAHADALQPLRAKLRAAEEATRAPFDACGMHIDD